MAAFGICTLSVVPVRKEPTDKSEMITQLLFGDMVELMDKQNQWLYIRNTFDDYLGWVDCKQITLLSSQEYEQFLNAKEFIKVFELTMPVIIDNHIEILALMGSKIPIFKNNTFMAGGIEFEINAFESKKINDIKTIALKFLNAPYLWGGKTPFGIDCSGFTQTVFNLLDKKLYRDANQQAEQGETINFIDEIQLGDLAFFDNQDGKIIHTGIILEKNKIIHASGFVRIDNIDHQGIYNNQEKRYTHKLRVIKRIYS